VSYPPPKYHGESGEVSARLRRATDPPDVAGANEVHYLATGESTGGEFGLYRWVMGPHRGGPDPHFHRTISESFYVLLGTVSLYDGTGWRDATAGDFLYVPQGGVHGFRNESGARAEMLLLFTPGAPREEYFETLADAARREAMDGAARAAFMDRHDTYWV
jgi:mannose-6-phosphate isomerase-like protein (cupin superfamily)